MVFLIENEIGFYTLEPIIDLCSAKEFDLTLYCDKSVFELVTKKYSGFNSIKICKIKLNKYLRLLQTLHFFITVLITPYYFSEQYMRIIKSRLHKRGVLLNLIYKFSLISPKVKKNHVNRILHRIFSLFPNYDFKSNLILVASRAGGNPVLLCQSKLAVITVMESWDHPVKIPCGFKSKIVYCWNNSLKNDWIEYQGDKDVQTFYPLKLRYWIENRDSIAIDDKKMVALYATGTSSNTQSWLFNKEMAVIDTLCRAIQNTNLTLLIKPKPNGVPGDFDVFKERYPKVIIGEYSSATNSTSYYLSDEINKKRKSELDLCDFVINTFTTFCIDAALYGKPVMQLDFLEADDFDEIAKAQKNHHIKNYLLNRTDLTIRVADTDNLIYQVSNMDMNDYSIFKEFSKSIVDWIAPDSLSVALEKLIFDVDNLKKLANEK